MKTYVVLYKNKGAIYVDSLKVRAKSFDEVIKQLISFYGEGFIGGYVQWL